MQAKVFFWINWFSLAHSTWLNKNGKAKIVLIIATTKIFNNDDDDDNSDDEELYGVGVDIPDDGVAVFTLAW